MKKQQAKAQLKAEKALLDGEGQGDLSEASDGRRGWTSRTVGGLHPSRLE
jgi:hypothetical protein